MSALLHIPSLPTYSLAYHGFIHSFIHSSSYHLDIHPFHCLPVNSLPHPITRSHLIDCLCARPCSKTFLCFLSSSLHHPSMLWAVYPLTCVPINMSASPSSHQHLAGPSVQGWFRAGKGPSVLCPGKDEMQRPGDGIWVVGMRQGRRGGYLNQKRVFRSGLRKMLCSWGL